MNRNGNYCGWVQVSPEVSGSEWQPKAFEFFKWPVDLVIERWAGNDVHWAKVLDSCNSFSLFKQAKVIIISDAEKAIKQAENFDRLLQRFKQGPHRILFQSESPLPTNLKIPTWVCESPAEAMANEKAGFQWIDFVHGHQLTSAIAALDEALLADQHPLALVQLITRDFRIGRIIHYAHQNRIREVEISTALRVPGFVIQKWLRRPSFPKSQWSNIFDRLLHADLELKSGADGIWVLRKLTFDLIQLSQNPAKLTMKKLKRPSQQPTQLLWTISPSFA